MAEQGNKPTNKAGLHSGHRQRMWKKYKSHGINCLEPHEVLEMLLFSCYPRRNTNDIAHELLNCFGSLNAVMNASPDELMTVKDVGPSAALTIAFFRDVMDRMVSETYSSQNLGNTENTKLFLTELYKGSCVEIAYVMVLDDALGLVSVNKIAKGTNDHVEFSIKDITAAAWKSGCTKIMISHNHPDGVSMFTAADVSETRRIAQALSNVGMELVDHLVVSGDSVTSMRECSMLRDIWF